MKFWLTGKGSFTKQLLLTGMNKGNQRMCMKMILVGKARGPDRLASEQIKWGGTKLQNDCKTN